MIFLDYLYTLPNATSGLDDIVVDTVTAVPSLAPLIITFTFFTVWLGGIARQKMRGSFPDYAMWCVVGALGAFMITMIMSLIEGLIRLDWLAIVITVNILAAFWLFMDRRSTEI